MKKRFRMIEVQPAAYKVLMGIEDYLKNVSLEKKHRELIKLRVSQINGCAFCLDLHFKEAMVAGEDPNRIVLLNAWKDSGCFNAKEQAILALTDAVTLISDHDVSDEIYNTCIALLGEEYTAQILMAILAMNNLNRLAKTSRMQPGEKPTITSHKQL